MPVLAVRLVGPGCGGVSWVMGMGLGHARGRLSGHSLLTRNQKSPMWQPVVGFAFWEIETPRDPLHYMAMCAPSKGGLRRSCSIYTPDGLSSGVPK